MRVLTFDTETTGLSKNRNAIPTPESNLTDFPHIVQFSWIFYDTETNEILDIQDKIIKVNPGTIISEKSISIHGITYEISMAQGCPIDEVITLFIKCVDTADLIVSHNIHFDRNMVLAEIYRLPQSHPNYDNHISFGSVTRERFYCTMENGTELCNIPSFTNSNKMGFTKYPKLSELYKHLFFEDPVNLHNSLNDTIVCLRCFYKMQFDKDICHKNSRMEELINLIK